MFPITNPALISGRQMHCINACIFLVAITRNPQHTYRLCGCGLSKTCFKCTLYTRYKVSSRSVFTKLLGIHINQATVRTCYLHQCYLHYGRPCHKSQAFFVSSATPELEPILSHPASRKASKSSLVLTPPAALIRTASPICSRNSFTSPSVAPPVPQPVEVLI